MELLTCNVKLRSLSPINLTFPPTNYKNKPSFHNHSLHFQCHVTSRNKPCSITIAHARKKKENYELDPPVLEPSIIDEVTEEEFNDDDDDDDDDDGFVEDELLVDDDEFLDDEAYFEDEYVGENAEVHAGDGAEGGGIALAGTWWDKEALAIAENVADTLDGDLGMYAFRTLANATIQVRIEKLSTKFGSPSISDIEAFSKAYRAQLDEAELAKTVPENISLEVSSTGVERVVRIPEELDRFKERSLYVKYIADVAGGGSSSESDGVFRLVSFDPETNCCTWGLADVKINREKAGKGRPMSKKQREWRLTTAFDSLRLVRLYSEI